MTMFSPFELRFNIFNTAKDILETQYKANLAAWDAMDKATKKAADLAPKYPTIEEIVEKATEINKFVSETSHHEFAKMGKRLTATSVIF